MLMMVSEVGETFVNLNLDSIDSENTVANAVLPPHILPSVIYRYVTFDLLPASSLLTALDLKPYESPRQWPPARKQCTIWLCCGAACMAAYAASSYTAPATEMAREWQVSEMAIHFGTTAFCSGFAVAPMVLAPVSEMKGRYAVLAASGCVFMVSLVGCATANSYIGMMIWRLWTGVGSSAFSAVVGGVVSDLYCAEERNTPMAIFAGSSMFGIGMGPVVSSTIVQNAHWRWVFWIQAIVCGSILLVIILLFKETRSSVILSRKAEYLNRWNEEHESAGHPWLENLEWNRSVRWKVQTDGDRSSIGKMILISLSRPFSKSKNWF